MEKSIYKYGTDGLISINGIPVDKLPIGHELRPVDAATVTKLGSRASVVSTRVPGLARVYPDGERTTTYYEAHGLGDEECREFSDGF